MEDIDKKIKELIQSQKAYNEIYQPVLYRLAKKEDKENFNSLLDIQGIKIFDTLEDQIKELIKIKNPSYKYSKEELDIKLSEHVAPYSILEYGVWVYYPWSNRLVHIPDEEEFIEIRTSRNQYKITKEERDILRTKKIGVIGLSVGQSVSVTLAMERICGELRLADFDTLELNNLNRIRTGLHNLDEFKAYTVAREIAEIDPFIIVKCFTDGVKEENIDEFFTGGGNLDLLVEESDGFDIKIISRYKARSLKIPVIMEASDRCMVDVERFDLEPERSILHGIVDHLDIETLKSLKTNEEKIPYMLDILGLDTCSLRLRASMIEIEQSINTWPQLASAVTMGGGITADVSRRLLLNSYTESGRYHIDIEELIGNKISRELPIETLIDIPTLTEMEMEAIIQNLAIGNQSPNPMPKEEIIIWLQKAITAPSAGNNQPWKWYVNEGNLYLFHDIEKSAGWTDPFNHLAYIAFGAAIANVKLAALASGFDTIVNYFPSEKNKLLIASFDFKKTTESISTLDESLYSEIGKRCTNRKKGDKQEVPGDLLLKLGESLENNSDLLIEEDPDKINEIAEIVSTIEMLRFLHPEGHKEFFNKELRWTEKEINETKDGLDIETLELSYKDKTGLRVASDPEVMAKVREWNGGGALQKISKESIKTSSAIGLIRINEKGDIAFLKGGESMQRVWLSANFNGLSIHPISSPIFFFERIEQLNDLPQDMAQLIKSQKAKFENIFPIDGDMTNIFLFRISNADGPSKLSLRRDLKDCLVMN